MRYYIYLYLKYLPLLAISVFYIVVFIEVMRPDVSPEYRSYYITKETDCWPRPIGGKYQLGRRLDFRADADTAANSDVQLCGWARPERDFTWTLARDVRLLFRPEFDGDGRGVTFELTATPFLSKHLSQQVVDVYGNGSFLTTWVFDRPEKTTRTVAVPAVPAGSDVRIALILKNATSPQQLRTSGDNRRLGLAVASVTLRQVD